MLLLIVLYCLQFAVSHGFRFDSSIPQAVAFGNSTTLSWHRNGSDPDRMDFLLANATQGGLSLETLASTFSATDLKQPNGTLNVTFGAPGEYFIHAINDQGDFIAVTAKFFADQGVISPFFPLTQQSGAPESSSSEELVQSTASAPPKFSSKESVQSTATAPPTSNSAPRSHRKRKTSVIIGAVIGSLVSLLLIFGSGTYLFIRWQRKQRNLECRLSPNLKIVPELTSDSPPTGTIRKENREIISPMRPGEMSPMLRDRNLETIEEIPEEIPPEAGRERINIIGTPLHVGVSETQSVQQQEAPQPALGDVAAEVMRLREHVQQLIEREAERAQGNMLDPPPAYA
ncbi:hypothetical protein ARMGADRAFT_1090155 [Armillaria gallica]|uniref:Mid2 domain-containing protein n=1 Tax=Armillaria gallica TaxID=47427 RepID=A0A2H3CMH7_ARMGA|nr:hypothetical protein ARMGADRAFT_1090155 [Armillaria gallica]